MKIIKCMFAAILTVFMFMVDLCIVLIAAGIGLCDRYTDFFWTMDSIKDYLRDRSTSYSDLWDLAMR